MLIKPNHSSLENNQDNSFDKFTTTNNIETTPPKKSVIERLSWIIAIVVGFIGIYEFILKKIIT